MEVLIRWQCNLCRQTQEPYCPGCNGNGYKERWLPHALLKDVRTLYKVAFVIRGRRKVREYACTAYLD